MYHNAINIVVLPVLQMPLPQEYKEQFSDAFVQYALFEDVLSRENRKALRYQVFQAAYSDRMQDAAEEANDEQSRRDNANRRATDWCFTLNNPAAEFESALPTFLKADGTVLYACWQPEIGSNGTRHLQGFICFKRPRGFRAVQLLLPRAHLEAKRGSRLQAIDYCRKSDTSAGVFVEVGERPPEKKGQGARADIEEVCSSLRLQSYISTLVAMPVLCCRYTRFMREYRTAITQPRNWETKTYVFIGPTATGKTRTAHSLWTDLWTYPGDGWFDSYDAHGTVLLDDFDGSDISYRLLLRILDRYPLKVPVKGGFVEWVPKTIVITTNVHPADWYNRGDCSHLLRRITRLVYFPTPEPLTLQFLASSQPGLEHSQPPLQSCPVQHIGGSGSMPVSPLRYPLNVPSSPMNFSDAD